jgi:hypothetical protein
MLGPGFGKGPPGIANGYAGSILAVWPFMRTTFHSGELKEAFLFLCSRDTLFLYGHQVTEHISLSHWLNVPPPFWPCLQTPGHFVTPLPQEERALCTCEGFKDGPCT